MQGAGSWGWGMGRVTRVRNRRVKSKYTGKVSVKGTWGASVEAAGRAAGWVWFTGTKGHSSGVHIAGPQAGHRWEAADPGAREGAVDTAGLALAACLSGAENPGKLLPVLGRG